jgi:hypothetical protein
LRRLLESRRSRIVIAQPPRSEGRDPGRLRAPIAGCTLTPGVGDASRIHVEPEDIINEGNAGRGLRARFRREARAPRHEQGFSPGRIVGFDVGIELAPQVVRFRFALDRLRPVADRRRTEHVGRPFGDHQRRRRRAAFHRHQGELVCLGKVGRLGDQRLDRSKIDYGRTFRGVELGGRHRGENARRKRGNAGLRRCPVAGVDGIENPAPVLGHNDRRGGRRGLHRDLSDDHQTLRLRAFCGRWRRRQRRQRIAGRLSGERRRANQCSQRKRTQLQDSSSIRSNKSFHASDLFEG